MSEHQTYTEYKKRGEEFSKRLVTLIRKISPPNLNVIAKDIGITVNTLNDLLNHPTALRRATMLAKVERYLEKMEREFK